MSKISAHQNHPKKGSSIKVEPIRSAKAIRDIMELLFDNPRDLCLFLVGINTAFRASELVSIKVGHVQHLQAGDILSLKQPKQDRYREVMLNEVAVKAIAHWLAIHPNPNPQAPLFISFTTGRALKSGTLSKYIKRWCKSVGLLGNYSSHTLRKTWGYHVYKSSKNRPIAELMIAYGHTSERQTLGYLCISHDNVMGLFKNKLGDVTLLDDYRRKKQARPKKMVVSSFRLIA